LIFFDRKNLDKNKELIEITDKPFIRKLKKEYITDSINKNISMPQIRGSIVNGNQNQFPYQRLSFNRKLRMLRADIFGALLCANSTIFLKT
jgi:hypothetical protein